MAPERIDEPLLVRALHDAGDYWEKLLLSCIIDERKARGFFVDPQEPPTSKQSYITGSRERTPLVAKGKKDQKRGEMRKKKREEEEGRGASPP